MIEWTYPNLLGVSVPASSGGALAPEGGIQYMQLELDLATWDVAIPMRWIRGPAAVVQRMRIRFRFWLGEWFLDQRLGVPYRERVLIKSPDVALVSAVFREVAEKTPGVKSIETFRAVYEREDRRIVVNFSARLTDGALVISKDEPFIVA